MSTKIIYIYAIKFGMFKNKSPKIIFQSNSPNNGSFHWTIFNHTLIYYKVKKIFLLKI